MHVDRFFGPRDSARNRVQEEIEELVRELTGLHDRLGHAFAADHGLSATDLAALVAVLNAEARGTPLTAGDLAGRLGVTSGAVTRLVDRLERVGHLRRSREGDDRRRVFLRYGEEGRTLAAEFYGPLGVRSDAFLAGFTDDELRVVHRFLTGSVEQVGEVLAAQRGRTEAP